MFLISTFIDDIIQCSRAGLRRPKPSLYIWYIDPTTWFKSSSCVIPCAEPGWGDEDGGDVEEEEEDAKALERTEPVKLYREVKVRRQV